MKGPYTIDASVFINAFIPSEIGHQKSKALLNFLKSEGIPMIAPTLLLPETAAAISRVYNDKKLAIRFAEQLRAIPQILFVPLDDLLSRQSIGTAANFQLRGSDAVYVSVALRYACPLVTLDREQYDRAAPALKTYYPEQLLKHIG
jgi:predicted nucleic acid-binding protein